MNTLIKFAKMFSLLHLLWLWPEELGVQIFLTWSNVNLLFNSFYGNLIAVIIINWEWGWSWKWRMLRLRENGFCLILLLEKTRGLFMFRCSLTVLVAVKGVGTLPVPSVNETAHLKEQGNITKDHIYPDWRLYYIHSVTLWWQILYSWL